MRLATIAGDGGATAAAVLADGGAASVRNDAGCSYPDVGALLTDGKGMGRARRTAETGPFEPYDEADLLRPVLSPGAVVCVGLNYKTHILEMGRELPEAPTLFSKLPRALTDPFADVTLPAAGGKFDYEGEVAAVIGAPGRNIAAEDAWRHVAGLTVCNDVTDRGAQWRTSQWFAGKTLEAATPVGPWVVTLEELGSVDALELRVDVNGETRQRASVGDLLFDVPALVADLSRFVGLRPGDLIATGTPGGVGHGTGRYLRDGDVVEVTVERIGSVRNVFREVSA